MTITDVIARITARGFTVQNDNGTLTVLDAQGNNVAWPRITVSAKGTVSDVALPSFHGGKITGLGDYPTAAIYGDVYLLHAGKPAQAEKAIAALLATPATPAQPVVEYNPELDATVNPSASQTQETVAHATAA